MDHDEVVTMIVEDLDTVQGMCGHHEYVVTALAQILGGIRMIADDADETAVLALLDEISVRAGFTP